MITLAEKFNFNVDEFVTIILVAIATRNTTYTRELITELVDTCPAAPIDDIYRWQAEHQSMFTTLRESFREFVEPYIECVDCTARFRANAIGEDMVHMEIIYDTVYH